MSPIPMSLRLFPTFSFIRLVYPVLCWSLWSTWTWVLCRVVIWINLHSCAYRQPIRLASFGEDTFFFPLYDFSFFVKNWKSLGVWVYLWVLDSIPSTSLSICIPRPCSFLLLLPCSKAWGWKWWFLQEFYYCSELF